MSSNAFAEFTFPPRLAGVARWAALFPVLLGTAAQATPPDAGQTLQELRPAPTRVLPAMPPPAVEAPAPAATADGARVAVRALRITGATAFAQAELSALTADAVGRTLTLSELEGVADRITHHYRAAGYLVAPAWLPPQEISDGVVEIAVVEGRIGRVQLADSAGLAASALAPANAVAEGAPVRQQTLESSLLALAELPGVEVKSTLRPGAAVGTSDLLIEVAPGQALTGSADVDNFGNRYTGTTRAGGSFAANNPLRLGDQLSLRVQGSEGGMIYGRAGYQLPVGVHATRIGAAWSDMRYRLGKEFAPLHATGSASVASIHALHPFVRSRAASLAAQVQFESKRLIDRVGATRTQTEKALSNWSVGINGSRADSGGDGRTTVALAAAGGMLALDPASTALDRATARSTGGFSKWSASFEREQRLSDALSLALSASAQWAGKNLDSSEKFTLGGAHGVRAYPQGEASGDEGRVASLELRWRLSDAWQAQIFYDDGHVTVNRAPWAVGGNELTRAGAGVGASYAGAGLTLRVFAAAPTGTGHPTSDTDRSTRVWVQAATYF